MPHSHPHARKQSILDGSLQSSSTPSLLSPSHSGSSPLPRYNASLDSIDESLAQSHKYPHDHPPPQPSTLSSYQYSNTHYASLNIPVSAPVFHHKQSSPLATPSPELTTFRTSHIRANSTAQTALGHGFPGRPHTATGGSFQHLHGTPILPNDGSELVLYAYVHLTGSMFLVPPQTLTNAWSDTIRRMRARRRVRGGGSMDIATMSPQVADMRAIRHSRRSSLASGLWGLLSPTSPASPTTPNGSSPFQPGHRPRSSTAGAFLSPSLAKGVGLGVEGVGYDNGEEWDPESPLSIFEVPNAMLGVDVQLEPGETKSCENYHFRVGRSLLID